jgi:low affinity Fe/Cu permease
VSTAFTPPPAPEERESPFERVADYVSAAMGRPVNIAVWLVLVLGWTIIFASGAVNPAGTFLPGWFTSQGFNFPLNLVTTVAELFIGFLVAAAANRSERNLNRTLAAIAAQEIQIGDVEDKLRGEMSANTELTRQVHDLVTIVAAQTAKLDEIHRHVGALAPQAGQFPAPAPAPGLKRLATAPERGQP